VAIVWKLTGEDEYRDKVVIFLRRLSDPETGYPSLSGGTRSQPHRATDNMVHEGVYFARMAAAYDLLYEDDVLTEEDHERLRRTIELYFVSAGITMSNGGIDNWVVCVDTGAILCSLILQDMARLNGYLYGRSGFAEQLSAGIMGDGWWSEGATNYHVLVAAEYNMVAQACLQWGFDLFNRRFPANFSRKIVERGSVKTGYLGIVFDRWGPTGGSHRGLRDLFDALIPFMDHRGIILSNNDSREIEVGSIYEQAYAHYRDPVYAWVVAQNSREDWQSLLYGVGELPEVPDPRTTSAYAENVGVAVLRSQGKDQTPEDQIQAAIKWGTHGGWHGHFDRTGFLSMKRYGKSFYTTMEAWYGYPHAMYKMWVQASVSHNMVVVDEYQQEPVESDLLLFASGDMMQACAVQTEARWCQVPQWPNRPDRDSDDLGVYYDPDQTPVLQRRLMIVTDDYIVLNDYLQSDQDHTFDWLIHPVGFRGMEAASKRLTRHTDHARSDPTSSYKHILDCDWYAVKTPMRTRFQDDVLRTDIRTLWPREADVMLGTFPVSERTFAPLVYEVIGDDEVLTQDDFWAGLLDKREIDVSVEGVRILQLRVQKRRHWSTRRKGVAWGDPRIVTSDGRTLYLADLELQTEHIDDGITIGRDAYGGPIQIVGHRFEKGIMADPEGEETGILTVDLGALDAVRFQATLGVDFPTGDERETRRTLLVRTRGKGARYLTLIEPYKDASLIQDAVALGPDGCRVELVDGRVQTIDIENMEGDGHDLVITMRETRGDEVIREEILGR
jgi:hypothetical protein